MVKIRKHLKNLGIYKREALNITIPEQKTVSSHDIRWIDDFIKSIKEYICLREEEKILILLPNQVYQLNDTAIKLLSHLLNGNSINSLSSACTYDAKKIQEIEAFMCDLRALVMGCLRDGEKRQSIEYIPYSRNFYTYPILSEIALTYRCNAACVFCYVNCPHSPVNEISTEDAKLLLKKIKEEAKVPSVSFTGGEPTLREDLFELIRFARRTGLRVNLITNGIRIDKNYALQLKDAGLNSAQVSLESADEQIHDALTSHKGAFQKTILALQHLQEAKIHTHTNTTINQLNKDSLPKLFELAAQLKLKRLSMNLLMPCGAADSHNSLWVSYSEIADILPLLKEATRLHKIEFMWYSPTPYCVFNPIENQLGNKTCAAAQGLLSIDPYGNILPCSSLNKSIGNMLDNEFDDIWFSDKAKYYRELKFAPNICRTCPTLNICGSACPIYFEKLGTEEIELKAQKN